MENNKCLNNCGREKRTTKGFCSQKCSASFLLRNRNLRTKGKTYVELYGEKRALDIQSRMSSSISKIAKETGFTKIGAKVTGDKRRGKKAIEIYGEHAANCMAQKIRGHFQGKTYEELYGIEKATVKRIKASISMKKKCSEPDYSKILYKNGSEGLRAFNRKANLGEGQVTWKNLHRGKIDGIRFDSGYEKKLILFLKPFLINGFTLTRFPFPVPYSYNEKQHDLYIDFALFFENKIVAALEAKGEQFFSQKECYFKLKVMNNFCKENSIIPCLFSETFYRNFIGNPDPSQLNSLDAKLKAMNIYFADYLVSWKEQRLRGEENETNTPLKDKVSVNFIPNSVHPIEDDDIVRHPLKGGTHV